METIVRTIYGANLQTCELLNLPVSIPLHTTLNEKFNINANISIATSDRPTLGYVTIGNGGHVMNLAPNGIAVPVPVPHLSRHAALYNHLPFVMREPGNDLTPTERSLYRLRRIEIHNGVSYVAYYMKLLDLSNTIPQMSYMTVSNGTTTATAFAPNTGDLNPTPPDLNTQGAQITSGDYISVTAKVVFSMTADEINELINVANILYNSPDYAIISEIGFCSGVDKSVMGDFNGTQSAYTDVIGAQIVNFVSTFYPVRFNNNGLSVTLDVGSAEPLLVLTSS